MISVKTMSLRHNLSSTFKRDHQQGSYHHILSSNLRSQLLCDTGARCTKDLFALHSQLHGNKLVESLRTVPQETYQGTRVAVIDSDGFL